MSHRGAIAARTAAIVAMAIVCLVASALMNAPPAFAGTFTVTGTCGLWRPYNNRPDRIAVYAQCYELDARNSGGPFTTPPGAEGGWIFDAPAGASIASFTLQGPMQGMRGWQAAVLAAGDPPVENCPGSTCPGAYKYLLGNVTYWAHGAPAVVFRLRCGSLSGCANDAIYGYFYIYSATVTIADGTPPGVRITGGPLVSGGWQRASGTVTYDAADNVGIKDIRAFLDGRPRTEAPRQCNYGFKTPCPNGGGALTIDTTGVPDGQHTLTVQAVDAADNVAEDTRTILVDNTPPSSPGSVTLAGPTGWRAANRFDVSWTNPPQSGGPITAAIYSVCPAAEGAMPSSSCVFGARTGSNIARIPDLQVPGVGAWVLRLWLRDAAGNEAPTSAVLLRGLQYDPDPPTLSFLPADPNDPARIRVQAADATSGLKVEDVEIRREGTDAWQVLPVSSDPGGFSAVVDDSVLPAGTYDVRARAVDAAGNERSIETLPNGAAATIVLPLRILTRLAVGKVRRLRVAGGRRHHGRYRRVLIAQPHVGYGRPVTLEGRLTTPGGNPVADANIDVWQQVELPGAGWDRVGSVRTSPTGSFSFTATAGPSRLLSFRYPGTPTIQARTSVVDLRVRAYTSIRVDRTNVVNGDFASFRGRLHGDPLPTAGKLVALQVYTRRQWRTFALARADASSGRWLYRYRFETVSGRVRFRFRARIPKEADYPYELGTSRQVAVTVRGA